VNTIILQNYVSLDFTIVDLLRRVRRTVLEALARQELAFEELTRRLSDERQIEPESLFQVMLIYQKLDPPRSTESGLVLAPFALPDDVRDSELTITAADMIFDIHEASTELTGALTARTAVYSGSELPAIIQGLNTVLEQFLTHINRPLGQLPLNQLQLSSCKY
jgi:non-ribosomal peptide synthetase component F